MNFNVCTRKVFKASRTLMLWNQIAFNSSTIRYRWRFCLKRLWRVSLRRWQFLELIDMSPTIIIACCDWWMWPWPKPAISSISLSILSSEIGFSKSAPMHSQKYILEYGISRSFWYFDSTNGVVLRGKFFTMVISWYKRTYLQYLSNCLWCCACLFKDFSRRVAASQSSPTASVIVLDLTLTKNPCPFLSLTKPTWIFTSFSTFACFPPVFGLNFHQCLMMLRVLL